ncbi:glycosyltransferase family 2 protein [Rhodopirellula halodulae]|uniref:glycosyltransferase family 2 protein n=1 Tax=Rhodopirellula halodulae TaxID=2894198 RepID=UPI001E637923|nr:glycosyltransferase family 2 protein [Rhodopirellula sp. JC737]MCC9656015.1 glycosyltransferase family 2 protein [Rhodopirellula sp. JC737]
MIEWLTWFIAVVLPFVALGLAGMAAGLFMQNLPLFTDGRSTEGAQPAEQTEPPAVSVLIPARDEEGSIEACVRSILQSQNVELEVIVLDDGSTDATGSIVAKLADEDSRVRLLAGIDLPSGWNGKQHACCRLSQAASLPHLLFLDADVRLQPNAIRELHERYQVRLHDSSIGLLSAFPHQQTGTVAEKMLIPMMHFLLLCYLPFARMRASAHPAYASGCGQLFFTSKEAYENAGTHAAIRDSRHDGLKLPKTYREQGMLSDCVDGTDWASCRMYTSTGEVVQGLLKNANEGIANPKLLIPFTILLGGANLLPWFTLPVGLWLRTETIAESQTIPISLVAGILAGLLAILISYVPRLVAVFRLRQSFLGAILHPVAIATFLLIQWWAFFNQLRGRQVAWRGRAN